MKYSENKQTNTGNNLGLSEQQKFDIKKPLRGQTGDDKGQRPVSQPDTVKTEKGTFKMR